MTRLEKRYLNKRICNQYGEYATIIKCNNYDSFKIKFDNEWIEEIKRTKLRTKNFINPYTKTICSVGYIGEGVYSRDLESFSHWRNVIYRCYNKNNQKKYSTYIDCTVCEEWLNFQNFAKWYEENKWTDELLLSLDKDILIKGNKIYSPQNCVLIDSRINCLFIKCNKSRNGLIGTHKRGNKYISQCRTINNRKIHISVFNTPEEAFYSYKTFKENYIKQVADEYKTKYKNFPSKIYDAMCNWKVEIID